MVIHMVTQQWHVLLGFLWRLLLRWYWMVSNEIHKILIEIEEMWILCSSQSKKGIEVNSDPFYPNRSITT